MQQTSNFLNLCYAFFILVIFQKILKLIENNFGKQEENYYDQDYVYSENDALHFYHDYERVTWSDYLLEKIQELYDWIITDMNTDNSTVSKGSDYAPLPQVIFYLPTIKK